jgi:hypothetical protein
MKLAIPPLEDRPYRLQEVNGGEKFVFQNDANTILFRARMAASVLTLLLAVMIFLAAREMFGTGAGFLALRLISFDPTLLGHSALVTTDAGQACFLALVDLRLLPIHEETNQREARNHWPCCRIGPGFKAQRGVHLSDAAGVRSYRDRMEQTIFQSRVGRICSQALLATGSRLARDLRDLDHPPLVLV